MNHLKNRMTFLPVSTYKYKISHQVISYNLNDKIPKVVLKMWQMTMMLQSVLHKKNKQPSWLPQHCCAVPFFFIVLLNFVLNRLENWQGTFHPVGLHSHQMQRTNHKPFPSISGVAPRGPAVDTSGSGSLNQLFSRRSKGSAAVMPETNTSQQTAWLDIMQCIVLCNSHLNLVKMKESCLISLCKYQYCTGSKSSFHFLCTLISEFENSTLA